MKACNVKNCAGKYYAKGLCWTHYSRVRKHGTTEKRSPKRYINTDGYVVISIGGKKVHEHKIIAEKALGKPLSKGVEIHHVNLIRSDNRNENLVVCGTHAYHMLLHLRQRALDESGNANYRKCVFCKRWDDPKNLIFSTSNTVICHSSCRATYQKSNRGKEK